MKKIFFPASIMLIITSSILYSQNYYETYKQPALIEGSNLILSANPHFSAAKFINEDKYTEYHISGGAEYTKWRFTPNLLYSVSASFYGRFSRTDDIIVYPLDKKNENPLNLSMTNSYIHAGISRYLYKEFLYAGSHIDITHIARNDYQPVYNLNFYPYIGTGKLVNTARVSRSLNIQQVLLDEKIIKTPLPGKTLKKLIEILDKDYAGEFDSKYKDDADIEFYSQVEKILQDAGVIGSSLDSRTVLKISQALANNKFVYFPNYKGWQIQVEADLYTSNDERKESLSGVRSVTLDAIYGIPLGIKNNFTGSVFFTVPVKPEYLQRFFLYDFHSPVTLAEKFSKDLTIPFFDAAEYSDSLKYAISARFNFYHIINRNAGAYIISTGNIAKMKDNNHRGSFDISANLVYNILNRMVGNISMGVNKNYEQSYFYYVWGGLSYYLF